MTEVGQRLRRVRDQRMLTQAQLGDQAGVATFTISRIESGRTEPRYSTIEKLAEALHVDPMFLWQGEGKALLDELRRSGDSLTTFLARRRAEAPLAEAQC